jgi:hypothetical protein
MCPLRALIKKINAPIVRKKLKFWVWITKPWITITFVMIAEINFLNLIKIISVQNVIINFN